MGIDLVYWACDECDATIEPWDGAFAAHVLTCPTKSFSERKDAALYYRTWPEDEYCPIKGYVRSNALRIESYVDSQGVLRTTSKHA